VANEHLLRKVYFPRMVIPISAVLAGLVDLLCALAVLAGMLLYYRVLPGAGLLAIPLLVALSVLVSLGVGLWLTAFNVQFRDVRYVVPFLVQLWMFATPIVYPSSL